MEQTWENPAKTIEKNIGKPWHQLFAQFQGELINSANSLQKRGRQKLLPIRGYLQLKKANTLITTEIIDMVGYLMTFSWQI